MTEAKLSPLDRRHRELGARMTGFGGWEMPLSYSSGTLAEHRACRDSAVVFDVSHLGSVQLHGPDAFEILQSRLTNDLRRIGPGRAQYSLLLDEAASVIDDLIVWWIDDDRFETLPNASNTPLVLDQLGPTAVDVTGERALLALQGPKARHLLARVFPEAADTGRFRVQTIERDGRIWRIAGTGYTGEDGVEISVPLEDAGSFWDALLDVGFEPAGLGSRDTLRLEMALPLHGNEFQEGISPLEVGLGWVIGWDKDEFPGRAALAAERDRGSGRALRALLCDGRRPPRARSSVLADGAIVGEVTSGNVSPILDRGIALALVDPQIAIGDRLDIEVRGRTLPAVVVDPPFVEASEPTPI